MSVIFTTISDKFVVLCADKQATNIRTGDVQKKKTIKIEKLSPSVAIGSCGTATLCEIITDAVKSYVKDQKLKDFTLEELADCFAQMYYAAVDEYNDMPLTAVAKFVVAGKMPTGKLAAIEVFCTNNIADVEVYEEKSKPFTLIFEPEDLSGEVCNMLLSKAISDTKNVKKYTQSLLEVSHRKAVQYVSEHSRFVSPECDFILIEKK